MGWLDIFKKREPKDWRLVKVNEYEYHSQLKPAHPEYRVNDPNNNITYYVYTFYLYENQYQERKVELIDSKNGDIDLKTERKDSFVFRNDHYRKIIRPWLDGQYNPEIPSYESIKPKEFLDNLAGKIT